MWWGVSCSPSLEVAPIVKKLIDPGRHSIQGTSQQLNPHQAQRRLVFWVGIRGQDLVGGPARVQWLGSPGIFMSTWLVSQSWPPFFGGLPFLVVSLEHHPQRGPRFQETPNLPPRLAAGHDETREVTTSNTRHSEVIMARPGSGDQGHVILFGPFLSWILWARFTGESNQRTTIHAGPPISTHTNLVCHLVT